MPFHFPDGNANILTNAALDKYARIPEYKVCAVKVEKLPAEDQTGGEFLEFSELIRKRSMEDKNRV